VLGYWYMPVNLAWIDTGTYSEHCGNTQELNDTPEIDLNFMESLVNSLHSCRYHLDRALTPS
jgi:hypothetical protein